MDYCKSVSLSVLHGGFKCIFLSSRKQSWFDNHRKFLPQDHPFRKNKTSFIKNKIVVKVAPPLKSGTEILREIESLEIKKVTKLDVEKTNQATCKHCGWKKISIFWDLPYWSLNLIRHNIDVSILNRMYLTMYLT